MTGLSLFLCAALGCFIACLALMPLARQTSLVDQPAGRKQHDGNIPLVGGIAIFLTYTLVDFFFFNSNHALLLGMGLLICLGVIDDKFDLSAWVKLLGQTAASIIIVAFGGAVISSLGTLPGGRELLFGPLAVPASVIAVVGLINAFNMIDGIDGLAGGLALVALGNLTLAMYLIGIPLSTAAMMEIALFSGAVSGYLVLNLGLVPGQKIFLGDAGSMILGLFVAFHLIDASQRHPLTDTLPTSLIPWMVAVPVLDTLRLILKRLIGGHSPLAPDRNHIHHVLLDYGNSTSTVFIALLVISEAIFCLGFAISNVSGIVSGICFTIVSIAYCLYGPKSFNSK